MDEKDMIDAGFVAKEWEWPEPGKKWPFEKRREYLKFYAEKIGLANIPKKATAELMGISKMMLWKDFQAIYKAAPDKRAIQHSIVDFQFINKALLNGLMREFSKEKATKTEKASIARAIAQIEETHTKMLEAYGIKEIQMPAIPLDAEVRVHIGKNPKEKDDVVPD